MDIQDKRRLSSIAVRMLDKQNMPKGTGSGCFLLYKGYYFFLTVRHNKYDDESNIEYRVAFEQEWCVEKHQMALRPITPYKFNQFSIEMDDKKLIELIVEKRDYIRCKKQKINPDNGQIEESEDCIYLQDIAEPDIKEDYGFSGLIMTNHKDPLYRKSALAIYDNFKYLRTENDVIYFSIPTKKHPGHECFAGTSGAPILDSKGNLVALVWGGYIDTNELVGVSISKYTNLLDTIILIENEK